MRTMIFSSAALLAAAAVPAQAQDLGTIINSVFGGSYSSAYQPYAYGYQPVYSYQPTYTYPSYGYSQYYSGYG